MMFVPTGVEVHLTLSYTGMREGMDGLQCWCRPR